jgi:ribosomal protein L7/L12
MSQPVTELPNAAVAALNGGNKIQAIKIVRAARGMDLKSAKDCVDRYVLSHPELQAKLQQQQSTASMVLSWLVLLVAVLVAILLWVRSG